MNAIVSPAELEPIEVERCDVCQRVIEDFEQELIYLRANDLLVQWELADPRDAWRHTGEAPPSVEFRNGPIEGPSPARPKSYETPASTEQAFWIVVRQNDPARLKQWLADRPEDTPHLRTLLEKKCSPHK